MQLGKTTSFGLCTKPCMVAFVAVSSSGIDQSTVISETTENLFLLYVFFSRYNSGFFTMN